MQPVTTEYSVRLVIRTRRSGSYTREKKAKVLRAIKQKFESAKNGQCPYTVDVCEVRETRTVAARNAAQSTIRVSDTLFPKGQSA